MQGGCRIRCGSAGSARCLCSTGPELEEARMVFRGGKESESVDFSSVFAQLTNSPYPASQFSSVEMRAYLGTTPHSIK